MRHLAGLLVFVCRGTRGRTLKILVAGASGVIGRQLVAALTSAEHTVVGLTHSRRGGDAVRALGAEPIAADVLDRVALLRAVDGIRADAVIHQLTAYRNSPPTHYRSAGVRRTNALRTTGTRHLLEAAVQLGAHRYLTQSLVLGYGLTDHGERVLTEADAFGTPRGHRSDPAVAAMRDAEQLAFETVGIQSSALRYGLFYGPGASDIFAKMLRRRMMPLPRGGTGLMAWIHVGDAVAATLAALEHGKSGQAYNIVDDAPVSWDVMLEATAEAVGAARPVRLPAALVRMGAPFAAAQMIDTSMRVSNELAGRELGWRPALPSYKEGLATLAGAR